MAYLKTFLVIVVFILCGTMLSGCETDIPNTYQDQIQALIDYQSIDGFNLEIFQYSENVRVTYYIDELRLDRDDDTAYLYQYQYQLGFIGEEDEISETTYYYENLMIYQETLEEMITDRGNKNDLLDHTIHDSLLILIEYLSDVVLNKDKIEVEILNDIKVTITFVEDMIQSITFREMKDLSMIETIYTPYYDIGDVLIPKYKLEEN